MADYTQFSLAIELLSGGRNAVRLDNRGFPSVLVRLPARQSRELCSLLPDHLHPGFQTGNQVHAQVYLSKYPNVVRDGFAYSLPLQAPGGQVTYDAAILASSQKGVGWGLAPTALWSALALEAQRKGIFPRGNNQNGRARHYPEERGLIVAHEDDGSPSETAVGSGPVSWYHDHTSSGLSDLVGNVSEWSAGMRLVRGEIQIVPCADCMLPDADLTPSSQWWKCILPDGSLADPGSKESLKLDMEDGRWKISTRCLSPVDDARGAQFRDMTYDPNELPDGVPDILKELAIYPAQTDRSCYGADLVFANNAQEERICLRGGNWSSGKFSGMFYYAMDAKRNRCLPRLGFRSAYYELTSP